MADRIFRYLRRAAAVIFTAAAICLSVITAPIIADGYGMYKNAVENKPIALAVAEVRTRADYVPLAAISPEFLKQVVKSEDERFYYHFGVDPLAVARAAIYDILAGSLAQGGSTITQQLAKNLYFTFEKRYERKIAEVFAAFALERMLLKGEILELYCNISNFGEGCTGIGEAARYYYGVSAADLSLEQAAALVFTLKSPENYNPKVYGAASGESG